MFIQTVYKTQECFSIIFTYLFHNLENQGLFIIAASKTRNARNRPLARHWEYGSPEKEKTKKSVSMWELNFSLYNNPRIQIKVYAKVFFQTQPPTSNYVSKKYGLSCFVTSHIVSNFTCVKACHWIKELWPAHLISIAVKLCINPLVPGKKEPFGQCNSHYICWT